MTNELAKLWEKMDTDTMEVFQSYIKKWSKDMVEISEEKDIEQTVLLVTALAIYFKMFVKIAEEKL